MKSISMLTPLVAEVFPDAQNAGCIAPCCGLLQLLHKTIWYLGFFDDFGCRKQSEARLIHMGNAGMKNYRGTTPIVAEIIYYRLNKDLNIGHVTCGLYDKVNNLSA
jgi:hypothetical protein